MTEITWHLYSNPGQMATKVAKDVGSIVNDAVVASGQALVALPGGQSPLPIFEKLTSIPVPWGQVTVIPTDDRCVPPTSPLSNFAVLDRHFSPLGADVIPFAAGDRDHRDAAEVTDARLHQTPWPLDLVWLGMGTDGHTASIFPGPDLAKALTTDARALGVMPDPLPPEAPVSRVTLSRSAISAAAAVMLTIQGSAKRSVLEQALAEGAESALPVGRVLAAAKGPITIHWSE